MARVELHSLGLAIEFAPSRDYPGVAMRTEPMPLEPGKSKAVRRRNTKREIAAGKPPKQAAAIARRKAGLPMTKGKRGKGKR